MITKFECLQQTGGGSIRGPLRLRQHHECRTGRSSSVYLCEEASSGRRCVLKVNDRGGPALLSEWNILRSLRFASLPGPEPLAYGYILDEHGERVSEALLMERLNGKAPVSADDYRLLGVRLAELTRSGIDVADDTIISRASPLRSFQMISPTILPALDETLTVYCAKLRLTEDVSLLIHGDPAPENFLVDAGQGSLIDYGSARLGPPQFDLARACVSSELYQLANGNAPFEPSWIIDGYIANCNLDLDDLERWVFIAAVHTYHWRHLHGLEAGVRPAVEAFQMFENRLTLGSYRSI